MKKMTALAIILAMLLCGAALAEAKTVEPMYTQIDLTAPEDGIYGASFGVDSVADGALSFTVYTEDCYDIVDIATLEAGDTIVAGGEAFVIDTLDREDGLTINADTENALVLRAFDEDNCWKVCMDDDYSTWTNRGDMILPLAEEVTFTDGWDIEKDPETVTGADAVASAISGAEMDYFGPYNTSVRVEDGKIVEIVRSYMP